MRDEKDIPVAASLPATSVAVLVVNPKARKVMVVEEETGHAGTRFSFPIAELREGESSQTAVEELLMMRA